MAQKRPRVALVWAQFAAYHVDRCEAVAERLNGRADVMAIEVASASKAYFWEPSDALENCRKITLFPDTAYENIGEWRRFVALLRTTWRCSHVFVGIGYNQRAIIALSWLLRLLGVRVIAMSDSKFDDRNRSAAFELMKSLLLVPYSAAIVASGRSMAYFRFLGFRKRTVLPGYDVVSIDRISNDLKAAKIPAPKYENRHFTYVGRFTEKKNLHALVDGFALYASMEPENARRLVIAGSGELMESISQHVEKSGVAHLVDFPGVLSSSAVSELYGTSLALILLSTSEQWGLVVNEALAANLPVVVSTNPGSRDLLVRNLVNGLIVEPKSAPSLARALSMIANDEQSWHRMSQASNARAWMGDVRVFVSAVESCTVGCSSEGAAILATIQAELDAASPSLDGMAE